MFNSLVARVENCTKDLPLSQSALHFIQSSLNARVDGTDVYKPLDLNRPLITESAGTITLVTLFSLCSYDKVNVLCQD